jgi:hypothetical protein
VDVERPSVIGLDVPVVRALPATALFAVVTLLVGRAFAPSLAGAGVGLGRLVHRVGMAGDIVSQIFAFAAMMMAVLAVVAAARSRLPVATRLGAITLGGFAILPTLWAVHQPVPELSAALVGGSAAVLALLSAPSALRAPFARGPGLVVILVALGGLIRLGSVGVAFQAALQGGARLAPFARALATAGFFADVLAIAAAVAWLAARSRRPASAGSVAVLAVALFCTRQALAGRADDIHPLDIVLWQAATRLTTRPEPAVPLAFQIFVAFLGPAVAAWAVATRAVLAPLGAAVALALCAHGAVEMPPSALMLMIGALGLALTANDGRGMWASLGPGGAPSDRSP